MTFKEYRRDKVNWQDKLVLSIQEGKNLKKEEYSGADFDEDESYKLDDYEVIRSEELSGYNKHILTLKKG